MRGKEIEPIGYLCGVWLSLRQRHIEEKSMKYVVGSNLFLSRLQVLNQVILSKPMLPAFGCFLFDIEGTKMRVLASDGEVTIRTQLELIDASGDMKFMLDAARVVEILKEFPDQPLVLELDPNTLQLEVKYQNGYLSWQAENAENYPEVLKDVDEEPLTVTIAEGSLLGKGMAAALTATASADMGRRVMSGVYMDVMPGQIALVSSDGHKLVRYIVETDNQEATLGFTFPPKPAKLLKAISEDIEGAVVLTAYGKKQALIQAGDYEVTCLLIADSYPNYKSVIPQKNENVAVIDRAALLTGLKRMGALMVQGVSSPLVKIRLEENSLTLQAGDPAYSTFGEEKLVCNYSGTPLTIGFNSADLRVLLGNVETEDVVVKLADAVKAGLILPAPIDESEKKGGDLLILLMPILIN